MSYIATKIFVETFLITLLKQEYPDVVIKVPLVKVGQKKNDTTLAIHVDDGIGFRRNLGKTYIESIPGQVRLDIATPVETANGTKELDQLISRVKAVLQERTVKLTDTNARLRFGVAYFTDEGKEQDRQHYVVTLPYIRDEHPKEVQPDIVA